MLFSTLRAHVTRGRASNLSVAAYYLIFCLLNLTLPAQPSEANPLLIAELLWRVECQRCVVSLVRSIIRDVLTDSFLCSGRQLLSQLLTATIRSLVKEAK